MRWASRRLWGGHCYRLCMMLVALYAYFCSIMLRGIGLPISRLFDHESTHIAADFEMLSCIPSLISLTTYIPNDHWTLLPCYEAASDPYLTHPIFGFSITVSLPWFLTSSPMPFLGLYKFTSGRSLQPSTIPFANSVSFLRLMTKTTEENEQDAIESRGSHKCSTSQCSVLYAKHSSSIKRTA